MISLWLGSSPPVVTPSSSRSHQGRTGTAQTPQPTTRDELQVLIDTFVDGYNHPRPHRSLGRTTPAHTRRPKTGPAGTDVGPHYRIRHDRMDKTAAGHCDAAAACTTSASAAPTKAKP